MRARLKPKRKADPRARAELFPRSQTGITCGPGRFAPRTDVKRQLRHLALQESPTTCMLSPE